MSCNAPHEQRITTTGSSGSPNRGVTCLSPCPYRALWGLQEKRLLALYRKRWEPKLISSTSHIQSILASMRLLSDIITARSRACPTAKGLLRPQSSRHTHRTRQLPFKVPAIPSNGDHKALNRGTLGGAGTYRTYTARFCSSALPHLQGRVLNSRARSSTVLWKNVGRSTRFLGWRTNRGSKNVAGVNFGGFRQKNVWPRRSPPGGGRGDGLRRRGVWRNSGRRFSACEGRWRL